MRRRNQPNTASVPDRYRLGVEFRLPQADHRTMQGRRVVLTRRFAWWSLLLLGAAVFVVLGLALGILIAFWLG